jgi:putative phosphoribosyl transferase
LRKYREEDAIVLAIPRGGVPVGFEIARELKKELYILVSRKLPFPDNPEAGFGAVAEDGSLFLQRDVRAWIPKHTVERIVEEQKRVIHKRISELRGGREFPDISGLTVILTDDGLAMGSTMRAAISMCRHKSAGRIIVAVPVSGSRTAREISAIADELVVLETPSNFFAVAQAYRRWYDVSDREVIDIMSSLDQ